MEARYLPSRPLLLYKGACPFCRAMARLVMRLDTRKNSRSCRSSKRARSGLRSPHRTHVFKGAYVSPRYSARSAGVSWRVTRERASATSSSNGRQTSQS